MTNLYVTYTMPDKASRDGYYAEVRDRGIIKSPGRRKDVSDMNFSFPADSDTTLFLWEQWESRDHQATHRETEHFAEMGLLKEKYSVTTDMLIEDQNNG